jgi:recombinational DNA repair protein (RecF pathway)
MLHECNYCNKYKGIQAFHYSQEDVICNDCYDKQYEDSYDQFNADIEKAFILEERARLKEKLQQIDKDELPF